MAGFNSGGHGSPLANIVDQARMWWDGSTTATRVISVGLAILVVLCLGGAIMLAATPEMDDLFTNLDPRDAAAIAAKLDDDHIKYEMVDGETTIRVPSGDKDRLRMEMIRDGLPAKTGAVVGTDYLDKIGMGTTTDVQNQYIQLANEAELSQTISSMNEISSAVVHISPGNDSPFADSSASPTASVVIGLKPGATLSSDQVAGVANLVAKAVTGLSTKDVEVVDTNGNQLWDGADQAGPGGLALTRMMAEKAFSDDMRRQMQSYLDAVLGAHMALVSVHAELNYDQVHTLATNYNKGPVLSQHETDETYNKNGSASGAPTGAGGKAGSSSNTKTADKYPATTPSTGKTGDYEKDDKTVNYVPIKTDTETQQAPGGIKRLAVAVLVDNHQTADTITKLTNYLNTLAGVTKGDPSRVVDVEPIPFSNADSDNQIKLMKDMQAQEKMAQYIKIGAVALVAIVLLIIFLRSSKGGATRLLHAPPQAAFPTAQPRLQGQEQSDRMLDEPMSIEELIGDMPIPASAGPKAKPLIPEIEEHMDVKLESVRDMVKNHPRSVALLMKGWMSDSSDSGMD